MCWLCRIKRALCRLLLSHCSAALRKAACCSASPGTLRLAIKAVRLIESGLPSLAQWAANACPSAFSASIRGALAWMRLSKDGISWSSSAWRSRSSSSMNCSQCCVAWAKSALRSCILPSPLVCSAAFSSLFFQGDQLVGDPCAVDLVAAVGNGLFDLRNPGIVHLGQFPQPFLDCLQLLGLAAQFDLAMGSGRGAGAGCLARRAFYRQVALASGAAGLVAAGRAVGAASVEIYGHGCVLRTWMPTAVTAACPDTLGIGVNNSVTHRTDCMPGRMATSIVDSARPITWPPRPGPVR